MIAQIIAPVGLFLISSCTAHSVVAEYKHLDKKIMNILFRPLSPEDWDKMLQAVEYYTMKVMNYGLRISQEMETDKMTVNKIVKYGLPKFANYTIREDQLPEEFYLGEEKIQQFYDLCSELRSTWNEFVKIAKAMKWQKRTRKPYIVQCAFHGRRLGKRKGRKTPYSIEEEKEKKKDKTDELIYTRESDWS